MSAALRGLLAHVRDALPWPRAAWWRTVLRFGLLGPLIGGAPYNWLLFPIPFAFAIGLGPALVCGALYALWRDAPARRPPEVRERLLFGALCGAIASAVWSVAVRAWAGPMTGPFWLTVLLAHGVPAGAVLGWLTPLSASRTSSDAPAPAWPGRRAAAPRGPARARWPGRAAAR